MATAPDDQWMDRPAFAGRAPTRLLTSSEQPAPQKPRKVPPAIGRIIGELGLRYRPSIQADLEAHGEALKLLTLDLIDVPEHLLEAAAQHWVRTERFMPRAAELIALAQKVQRGEWQGSDFARRQMQEHCDRLNAFAWCRGQWRLVQKNALWTVEKVD